MEPFNLDPNLQQNLLIAFLLLGGLILLADGAMIIVWLFSKDREERGEPPLIAPFWSVAHAFFLMQIGFILANLFYLIVLFIGAALFYKGAILSALGDSIVLLVGLIGQNAILTGLPLALIVRFYRAPITEIGFTLAGKSWSRLIAIGVLTAIPIITFSYILERAMDYMARAPSLQSLKSLQEMMSKMVADRLSPSEPMTTFLLAFLAIAIIGPIGEEILFRGYIYTVLKKRFKVTAAVIISGVLFAAVHIQPLAFLPIFSIGVALALLREYTGSLVPCILVHILNNGSLAVWMYFQLEKHI